MSRRRRYLLAAGALLVVGVLAVVLYGQGDSFTAQANAPASQADSVPADLIATAPGWVDVKDGTHRLGVREEGTVQAVPVKAGDEVAADALLLKLDSSQAAIELNAAQIEKLRRVSEEVALDAQLKRARDAAAVLQPLVAQQAESGEALRQARERVADLETQLQLARFAAQTAALQVRLAQGKLARLEIRAPAAGKVLRVLAQPGNTVAPGSMLIWFASEGPMIVRAELDERLFDRVTAGMKADVVTEFDNSKKYSARVTRVAHAIGPVQTLPEVRPAAKDDRVVECVLELDTDKLLVGQRVLVRIRGTP